MSDGSANGSCLNLQQLFAIDYPERNFRTP